MLYTNLNEISSKPQIISDFQNNLSTQEILLKYNLTLSELLAILSFYKIPKGQLISVASLHNINSSQILVITDTHLGNQRENIAYLNYVYQFAKEQQITSIIHAGDIIQSTIGYPKKEYLTPESQIKLILEVFPNYPEIKTYFLLGNHDFHLLKKDPSYINFFNERNDFNLLGMAKSYLTWQNHIISVTHQIKRNKLVIPNLPSLINFIGHRHSLKLYNNTTIAVPTLSDDLKFYEETEVNSPGFLLATIQDNLLSIELYSFQNDHIDKTIILQKSTLETSNNTKKMIL